jgi:hypothetical protein
MASHLMYSKASKRTIHISNLVHFFEDFCALVVRDVSHQLDAFSFFTNIHGKRQFFRAHYKYTCRNMYSYTL